MFVFFTFLKCYLLLYPVKALAIKIGLGFRFCILRTRDYYCDDEGRGELLRASRGFLSCALLLFLVLTWLGELGGDCPCTWEIWDV